MKYSKCIFFFITFIFLQNAMLYAQKTLSYEELQTKFLNSKEDTTKLSCLVKQFELKLNDTNYFQYYKKAKDFSSKLLDKKNLQNLSFIQNKEVLLNVKLSEAYLFEGKNKESIELIQQTIELANKFKNKESIDFLYDQLGLSYLRNRDLKNSLLSFKKAISLSEKTNDNMQLSNSYTNLGLVYLELDDEKNELDCYYKSIAIKEKNNLKDIYYPYISLASSFTIKRNFDKADQYLKKTFAALKLYPNDKVLSEAYLRYADLYSINNKDKDFGKVFNDYIHKSMVISKKRNYLELLADAELLLTAYEIDIGDYEKAIIGMNKSFSFFEKKKDYIMSFSIARQIALINYTVDSLKKNNIRTNIKLEKPIFVKENLSQKSNIEIAILVAQIAHKIAIKYGIANDKYVSYRTLRDLYTYKGDYKLAFENYKNESFLRDSISKQKYKELGLARELQYNYDKKAAQDKISNLLFKKRLELQLQKEENSKLSLYYGLLVTLLSLFLLYSRFKYVKKKKEIIIESQKLEVERKEKENIAVELSFLKSQISPHFIFNAINSIYFQISKTNTIARGSLMGFSEILRYQLYDSNQEKVSIDNEIKFIKDYIHFQLNKNEYNQECKLIIAENVKNFQIQPMILITFVENAFKYLKKDSNQINIIEINMQKTNDSFIFEIQNDYNNKSIKKNEYGGIGLQNAKRRLELMYKNKYELKIDPGIEKFKVYLSITIN